MAKKQSASTPVETEPVAVETAASNGEVAEPKDRTVITEYVLKLQRHKDVPTVPELLEGLEEWAAEKGYVIQKKEVSTPNYHSWVIHTKETFEAASKTTINREIRSLREDDAVKARAAELGISVDDLLKRALLSVRDVK